MLMSCTKISIMTSFLKCDFKIREEKINCKNKCIRNSVIRRSNSKFLVLYRVGWIGDITQNFETGMYNYNLL